MSDDNWRAVPETLLFIARFEFRIFGRKRVIKRTPFEKEKGAVFLLKGKKCIFLRKDMDVMDLT